MAEPIGGNRYGLDLVIFPGRTVESFQELGRRLRLPQFAASALTVDKIETLFRQDGAEYELDIQRGDKALKVKLKVARVI